MCAALHRQHSNTEHETTQLQTSGLPVRELLESRIRDRDKYQVEMEHQRLLKKASGHRLRLQHQAQD